MAMQEWEETGLPGTRITGMHERGMESGMGTKCGVERENVAMGM